MEQSRIGGPFNPGAMVMVGQCNAMCCNTIRCNAMNKNAMQWKKVNKSGRSTPGAMVMVGAGHVSAQCQETQPLHSCESPALHFPCIVLYCPVSESQPLHKSQALHFPLHSTFQTSHALHCLACIALHCIVLFCSASGQRRSALVLFIACHRFQYYMYVASQHLNAMF